MSNGAGTNTALKESPKDGMWLRDIPRCEYTIHAANAEADIEKICAHVRKVAKFSGHKVMRDCASDTKSANTRPIRTLTRVMKIAGSCCLTRSSNTSAPLSKISCQCESVQMVSFYIPRVKLLLALFRSRRCNRPLNKTLSIDAFKRWGNHVESLGAHWGNQLPHFALSY